MLLKIGELAKRIGLTVRTLHHYDAIGLVKPSTRSDAGYRLYNRNDVARLHRVQALRGLGLSLSETGDMLAGDGAELHSVIRQQITSLQRQISQAVDLRDRLQAMEAQLAGPDEPDLDEWLSTLGLMTTHRKYFTPEELDILYRRKDIGNELAQWTLTVAKIRDHMDRGIAPQSKAAQALAANWLDLQRRITGDDPRFFVKLSTMHRTEFDVQALTGVDGAMLDYVTAAVHESRCESYAKYLDAHELLHYRRNFPKCMPKWLEIFAEARQMLEQRIAPASAEAQAMFLRWELLAQATWGSDPVTRHKVREAHRLDSSLLAGSGMTPELQAYVTQGMAIYTSNSMSKMK